MKKILSIILSLLLVFSAIPFTMMSASAEGEVAYQTIVDMSDYDGVTLNQYDSPWYTEGLTRSYNIGKTSHSYDAETDSIKFTRGAWDPCGLYYFDDSLGVKFSDSLGFRVWIKGDADSGADVTSQNNFIFAVDTVDETGAHVVYGAYGYERPSYKIVVPAEGAWVEIRWADFAKSWKVVGKTGMQANRPSFYMTGSAIAPETILSNVDGFVVGFNSTGGSKIYHIGDFQLIKPAVTVNVDGQDIVSISGEKITLPEPTTEGVIAYSDGEKLYYPGDEYVVPGNITLTNIKAIIGEDDEHDFVFDTTDKAYTGSEICPTVSSATLVEGEDYVVSYENNVNAGTGTIKVTGIGECFIDLSANFTITRKTFEETDFMFAEDGITYTGEALEPEVVSDIFTEDDFSVVYHNNVNASDNAYAVVEAKLGNGVGAVTLPFSIEPKEITDDMFEINSDNKTYTDSEIKTTITSDLVLNQDYEVAYANNVNVGTATVTITGKGNYTGTVTANYEIVPQPLGTHMFNVDVTDKVYTSKEICPVVFGALANKDYAVTYENNVNVGVGTITITGKNNYGGTLTYNFNILQKEIEEADFDIDLSNKVYTGEVFDDLVTSETLQKDDFAVVYADNQNAGTATVTITGVGNCKGEIVKTFIIEKMVITEDDFSIDLTDKEYANEVFKPAVESTLILGEDYTVEYSEGTDVGTETIKIEAIGNNCSGSVEFTFEIVKRVLKETDFTLETNSYVYSGETYEPKVESALKDTDYTVVYEDNTNAGFGKVVITGKDNCELSVTLEFEIAQQEIEKEWFVLKDDTLTYTGEAIEVEFETEFELYKDYSVYYHDNLNAGTATAFVQGMGNFTGECSYTFTIEGKDLKAEWFELDVESQTFANTEICPIVTSDVVDDGNYTVTYANNINVGTATVTITGKQNYKGVVELTFEITPKAIAQEDFDVNVSNKAYTGEAITTSISSSLVKDIDYKVEYANNVEAGMATLTVQGIGNYNGTLEYSFRITTKAISDADFTVDNSTKVYTGEAITTTITSALVEGVDYKVEYANNVNAGTAQVYITGINNFAGETFFEFAIAKKMLSQADFTVDTTTKIFNGDAYTPEVATKLVAGKEYTVTYANNVNVGTASIIIAGVGNYTGEVVFNFAIEYCKHETVSVVGKVDATYFANGYSGDKVCAVCEGLMEQGSTVKKLKLAKPKFSVKAVKGKKQFKVTYKKVAGATGFQVRYRIKGKWIIKKFNAKKNLTKTIKTAIKKGTYKVQVRALVKSGKKTAYSAWASPKKVNIK